MHTYRGCDTTWHIGGTIYNLLQPVKNLYDKMKLFKNDLERKTDLQICFRRQYVCVYPGCLEKRVVESIMVIEIMLKI